MKNKGYKFLFKKVSELTAEEKEQMMWLMIATYPAFKKYYTKNKYYSTVKPQIENLIKNGAELVGVGKFLWRKISVGKKSVKLFAFGALIAKNHQRKGLGTRLIRKNIGVAQKMGADILYGSTTNPHAEKIMQKLKFKKLTVPVFYKDAHTKNIQREKDGVFVFEFRKGIVDVIQNLKKLYIGTGPL